MWTCRASGAVALASVALVVAGCSGEQSAADAPRTSSPAAAFDIPSGDVERVYREGLTLVFPDGDVGELIELGLQTCTYVRERGGVGTSDVEVMAEIAGDLAGATGYKYNEMQYGYIVGLASSSLCAGTQEDGGSRGA